MKTPGVIEGFNLDNHVGLLLRILCPFHVGSVLIVGDHDKARDRFKSIVAHKYRNDRIVASWRRFQRSSISLAT